ncbi:MAG: SGNH hydrolase domain-containing protein [Alysiella sp.]|uniref:SGNH hydrolase domain-containing protein n=1 Tax=Alysiella sp. TaxID=1872483 RepID=UPI0026DADFDE|nr:SGNH hydrolase domain-containing protein [Alysiella sp.]MDO4434265.1 SGNH hydrolase domain-containing protein [Alysiella sp.]
MHSQCAQPANYDQNFANTLQWLTQQGKQIYVIKDNPIVAYDLQRLAYLKRKNIGIGNSFDSKLLKNAEIMEHTNQKIKNIVAQYPQAHWVEIDFNRYLPHDFQSNGLPVYYDDDHFNPYGADYLAQQFIRDGKTLIKPEHLPQ